VDRERSNPQKRVNKKTARKIIRPGSESGTVRSSEKVNKKMTRKIIRRGSEWVK
jgi:hypothetical protein